MMSGKMTKKIVRTEHTKNENDMTGAAQDKLVQNSVDLFFVLFGKGGDTIKLFHGFLAIEIGKYPKILNIVVTKLSILLPVANLL